MENNKTLAFENQNFSIFKDDNNYFYLVFDNYNIKYNILGLKYMYRFIERLYDNKYFA